MSEESLLWYAIRVTYNRELSVKADLDKRGVENFVPMQYKLYEQGEKMVRKLEPSVHNLIFVRMSREDMRDYKRSTSLPIRYIMDRSTGSPIVVPDRQMQSFMAVASTYNEQLIYLTPKPGDFKRGDRVRVLGGVFAGAEGVFVRLKGDRRVVVIIEGVVAVATTFIHPSMIARVDT